MKTTILALALASTFTTATFAQSVGEKTGVNAVLGITPKTEDFIKEAATSDMLEIQAAKIAQQKGDADENKEHAGTNKREIARLPVKTNEIAHPVVSACS